MAIFWLGVILWCALLVYSDQDVEHLKQLHCKPKPGCTLAKCDPMPERWPLIGGLNPPSHEYPILCQNEEDSSCCGKHSITMEQKFAEMKSEYKRDFLKLVLRLEMTEKREAEVKLEIALLENEKSEIMNELEKLKKESTAIKRAADEKLRALENKVTWLQTHWYIASNGYYYKLFNSAKTWQQAKVACASEGTILASAGIRDPTVRVELQDYTKLGAMWIGVSDIGQEGTWMWEDGVRSTGDDAGWRSGEPNDYKGNEDCAYIANSSNNWKANDMPCSELFPYLCEKSP